MKGRPKRALLLAALVYPGAGQLVQRRWAAAAVFGIAGTLSLVFFFAYATVIIREYYRFAFEFDAREIPPLPVNRMLLAFLAALLIYIAGIADTVRANRGNSQEDRSVGSAS